MASGGVISGATRGAGGPALGQHLADKGRVRENDVTQMGASRGIVSGLIEDAIMELTRIVSHASSSKPVYHVHVDPAGEWSEHQWERYWILFESEFGFHRQAFVEALHKKHGREHRHRAYSRVRPNGTVIPLSHDYARREKIARLAEFEFGAKHVPGAHNRAVTAALRQAGHAAVADSIDAAGLTTMPKPVARMTPRQRHQSKHTRIDPLEVATVAFRVWQITPTEKLIERFALEGLCLCQGEQVPVLIDPAGGVHSLTRVIGRASAAAGQRIRAVDVVARVSDLHLLHKSNQGANDHDRSDSIEDVSDLDTQNHATPAGARNSRRASRNQKTFYKVRRQKGTDSDGRSDAEYVRKFGGAEEADRKARDSEARRAQQSREDTSDDDNAGTISKSNSRRAGSTGRAAGRHRIADCRVEQCLTEPDLAGRIEQIALMIEDLHPDVRQRRLVEDLRAEIILDQEWVAPVLTRIEALIEPLVRAIGGIVRRVFRGMVVGDSAQIPPGAKPVADEEDELRYDFGS